MTGKRALASLGTILTEVEECGEVRPAGLEPATPCLEVRFRQITEKDEFPSNIELSDSSG